jgi:hypothetical protein
VNLSIPLIPQGTLARLAGCRQTPEMNGAVVEVMNGPVLTVAMGPNGVDTEEMRYAVRTVKPPVEVAWVRPDNLRTVAGNHKFPLPKV